jgi:hypothetical protein
MKKTILEIYAMAVCFFCVACFVITTGVALYDVFQIADPEFTLNRYQYDRLQSNDAFRQSPIAPIADKSAQDLKLTSEEEITKKRRAELERILHSESHDGEQSLLRMLIIMLVDAVAFAIHWRVARAARSAA